MENNKEEVPFSHYEERFCQADAEQMASRSGVKWDGKEFYVNLLGETYAISHPVYGIRKAGKMAGGGERISPLAFGSVEMTEGVGITDFSAPASPPVEMTEGDGESKDPCIPLPWQTFLLRYLLEGKATPWQGTWKTFREMPWGELYIKPYTGRVLTRAAFTFGTRVDAFRAACEKMGALPLDHADAGYQLELLGDLRMQVLVWEGDDEFPPNAQVLYSDNFEKGVAPEDRVVAGDILISAIKANMN